MRGKLRLWTAPTRFGIGIYHREAKLNEIRRLLAKKNYPSKILFLTFLLTAITMELQLNKGELGFPG